MNRFTPLYLIFSFTLYFILQPQNILKAQSPVFQTALEKISLSALKQPVARDLTMKKWILLKEGKEKSLESFHEYMKTQKIYLTPPLKEWIDKKYFRNASMKPLSETWVLQDGKNFFIRHYNPDDPKNTAVEIYEKIACPQKCKELGYAWQIQYENISQIVKYDPKLEKSFDEFKSLLAGKHIVLRNYLINEIKDHYFDSKKFKQKYPDHNVVTWCLITPQKIIIRFAREGNDIDFTAISIPYIRYISKAWSLTVDVNFAGFSTSVKEISNYMDIGLGLTLARQFYNTLGGLELSNSGQFFGHFIDNVETEEPDVLIFSNSTILNQELYEYFEVFGQNDLYFDTSTGILFGWRIFPGVGYNFLGFENKYRFDPVVSFAFGYRSELDEIGELEAKEEIKFYDIIFSYRFSIGNIDYGSALFYWRLYAEYQHSFLSANSENLDTKILNPTERYRINMVAQFGFPILSGAWRLYFTYLQERIHDQLGKIVNHSGMLSFEAKIL
jgi:hypothetical protein